MSKVVLTDAYVSLDGVDLSASVRAVTLERSVDAVESSCMGTPSREFLWGADSWQGNITFAEDYANVSGSVNDLSPTPTVFDGDSGLSAVDDFYNGWNIIFTSGVNAGIRRTISDYVGSTRTITVGSAFPSAPADSDTFDIVNKANGVLSAALLAGSVVAVAVRPVKSSAISSTNPEYQGSIVPTTIPMIDGEWGDLVETGLDFQGTAILVKDTTP